MFIHYCYCCSLHLMSLFSPMNLSHSERPYAYLLSPSLCSSLSCPLPPHTVSGSSFFYVVYCNCKERGQLWWKARCRCVAIVVVEGSFIILFHPICVVVVVRWWWGWWLGKKRSFHLNYCFCCIIFSTLLHSVSCHVPQSKYGLHRVPQRLPLSIWSSVFS